MKRLLALSFIICLVPACGLTPEVDLNSVEPPAAQLKITDDMLAPEHNKFALEIKDGKADELVFDYTAEADMNLSVVFGSVYSSGCIDSPVYRSEWRTFDSQGVVISVEDADVEGGFAVTQGTRYRLAVLSTQLEGCLSAGGLFQVYVVPEPNEEEPKEAEPAPAPTPTPSPTATPVESKDGTFLGKEALVVGRTNYVNTGRLKGKASHKDFYFSALQGKDVRFKIGSSSGSYSCRKSPEMEFAWFEVSSNSKLREISRGRRLGTIVAKASKSYVLQFVLKNYRDCYSVYTSFDTRK